SERSGWALTNRIAFFAASFHLPLLPISLKVSSSKGISSEIENSSFEKEKSSANASLPLFCFCNDLINKRATREFGGSFWRNLWRIANASRTLRSASAQLSL